MNIRPSKYLVSKIEFLRTKCFDEVPWHDFWITTW
jgi:hypothetical protein